MSSFQLIDTSLNRNMNAKEVFLRSFVNIVTLIQKNYAWNIHRVNIAYADIGTVNEFN